MRMLAPFFALAGCASVQPPPSVGNPIYHYVRSNIDGTEQEHVVHYRPSRREIAVYKWVEKCTTAAYVTAEMDEAVREGRLFVAGKVARDGSQARFGTLTLDPAAPALVVDVTPPGGQRIQMRHSLGSRPFLIYDFDFADLNAFLQEHRPQSGFAYELPVIWPGDESLFRDYGQLIAQFAGEEKRLGRLTRRFDLTVDGSAPSTGTLWIDRDRGFIVEANLGLPNHQEYRDFRLRLDRIESGGTAAWKVLTRSQYAGCSTGN
jgi:hypothetical protein